MTTYGSVCSGIEAASTAWHPLGWKAAWLAEIEPFPSAILQHHYPETPNLGDMRTIAARVASGEIVAPDILTGGTPCQAFSIAGLRKGLSDDRGQLALAFCRLADAIDAARLAREQPPSVIVWENVPGVLSDKGNAFGCFLAGLAGEDDPLLPPGGRWAYAGRVLGPTRTVCWRVLDAQYFGVAQRRRRVWVVASARPGFDPATVLFERDGVRRDTAPSRETREDIAGTLTRGLGERGAEDPERDLLVFGGNNTSGPIDVAPACNANRGCHNPGDFEAGALCVAFPEFMSGTAVASTENLSSSLGARNTTAVASTACVRRLMPVECERLMGFPDGHTCIPVGKKKKKLAKDGPRYKALGNSWAVPCAKWIGARIARAFSDPQSLITGLPVPTESLIPPPHCRAVEYDGHVFLVDGSDTVHFEASPDGYDAENKPVWASPESRAQAMQRAEALGRLITKMHSVPMGVKA